MWVGISELLLNLTDVTRYPQALREPDLERDLPQRIVWENLVEISLLNHISNFLHTLF